MRRQHRGLATVEFAIVGGLLFMVLFGVFEFGRAMFVANALAESTRRGARVAAICRVGDPRPAQVAIFADGDGQSLIAPGLTTDHVEVAYLDQAGAPLPDPIGSFSSIRYVRVRITNFTQQLLIPFVMPEMLMPQFSATLPAESLGYSPTQEAFLFCQAV